MKKSHTVSMGYTKPIFELDQTFNQLTSVPNLGDSLITIETQKAHIHIHTDKKCALRQDYRNKIIQKSQNFNTFSFVVETKSKSSKSRLVNKYFFSYIQPCLPTAINLKYWRTYNSFNFLNMWQNWETTFLIVLLLIFAQVSYMYVMINWMKIKFSL